MQNNGRRINTYVTDNIFDIGIDRIEPNVISARKKVGRFSVNSSILSTTLLDKISANLVVILERSKKKGAIMDETTMWIVDCNLQAIYRDIDIAKIDSIIDNIDGTPLDTDFSLDFHTIIT